MKGLTDYITQQPWEDTITAWYVRVDDAYQRLVAKRGQPLRSHGPEPTFSDSEVITVSLVVETFFQGHERAAYTDAIVAQAERMRVLTSEVYDGLAADLVEPLAEMEQELEDHQQAMEELEAGHAERMAALSPAGLKVEIEKAANAQLAAERRRILDDLADLEAGHQEKVQIYQAQGKEQSIANENAAYEVKKANLEAALADLDGKYGSYYANQLARLQASNAEATALEEQKYAEEKARLEAAQPSRSPCYSSNSPSGCKCGRRNCS